VRSAIGTKSRAYCYLLFLIFLLVSPLQAAGQSKETEPFRAVSALIDIRTSFSDGAHSMENVIRMARAKGFKVLFINDHDRIELSYGLPPFRRIIRYKKSFPSIMTHGPEKYLEEIRRLSGKYPDMIIIPGCITSPFYYLTGSWFKKNLTVHDYDRRLLIVNFNKPEDYNHIPNLGNKMSLSYTRELLPGMVVFIVPLVIGLILLRWKGFYRTAGIIIVVFSVLAMVDYNPFRSSRFSPYDPHQGFAPYQEVINYVQERGGLCFWNYPEQKSGIRKYGPIQVKTLPYPKLLYQTRDYTGFAAIYGDNITVTDPGKEWDRVLEEYCSGKRKKPVWGISTADFHEEGRLGLKLGAFPTTLLVKRFSKQAILEAMKKGRMYCSRGDGRIWPKIDHFYVVGPATQRAYMGERMTTSEFPLIRFEVSFTDQKPRALTIFLIRGGKLIKTFKGKTPIEVEYVDKNIPPGRITYYRLMDTRKHLTSNPIFVRYHPPR